MKNATLATLMNYAFGYVAVENQPKWFLTSTWYTIQAEAPRDKGLSYEELRVPLQHLLEDRLHLRYHREMEQVSGYALVLRKDGPKLEETKGGEWLAGGWQGKEEGKLVARNASMEDIATALQFHLGYGPIVDETGVKGRFDARLGYRTPDSTESNLPPLMSVVHDRMGLDVIKKKVSRQTIVIDSVDQFPTED